MKSNKLKNGGWLPSNIQMIKTIGITKKKQIKKKKEKETLKILGKK